jgi:hypothetical protein
VSVVLVLVYETDASFGDQTRYLNYASNILDGFYSPPAPDIDLGNGPGYPLLLVPFVAMGLPLVMITLLNALLFYLSIVYLFKTLERFVSFEVALLFSLFFAFYLNAYENITFVLPETLSLFLVTLAGWAMMKTFDPESSGSKVRYILLTGFLIGYLALTKPIFGYVIAVFICVSIPAVLVYRKSGQLRSSLFILLIALTVTLPYLGYTWNLTGRFFYWSSFGGDNLYWMSTPHQEEYGSWILYNPARAGIIESEGGQVGLEESFYDNHSAQLDKIAHLKGVEKDDALRNLAIHNIREHPEKFLLNCLSNMSRILFNFPYSYKLQSAKTLVRLPFNGAIVFLALVMLIPTILNWRKIPYPYRFLLLFSIVYLGGSLLGSAETRMFTIIVPFILFWLAFMVDRTVTFRPRIS